MKIIRTVLGWEIQPQGETETAHVRWLLDCLATRPAAFPVVADAAVPDGVFAITREQLQRAANKISCPRCYELRYLDGACGHCGYRADQVRTFTTKGPVE